MNGTDRTYLRLLNAMCGGVSRPQPRGFPTREIANWTTQVMIDEPIVSLKARELDYEFMFAEAEWILSGSNQLDHHPAVRRNLQKYSDDGITMHGAYGPWVTQQMDYVVTALQRDWQTRQAVMTMWKQSPKVSLDIPCTISLQFILRQGFLNCTAVMRSSDAWLGWPYDVFSFSMIARMVCIRIREMHPMVLPGVLTLFAGSQHLYEKNIESSRKLGGTEECHGINFDIINHVIKNPDDLMCTLVQLRDNPTSILL